MTTSTLQTTWLATKIVSVSGLAVAAAIYLIRNSDLAAARESGNLEGLLLGSASLILTAFAAIIAIAAIVGWQSLQITIQERIDAAQRQKIEVLEKEMRGRALSALGYMAGEMSIDPESLSVKKSDSFRLREAIKLCEDGYNFLKDLEGGVGFATLNNLVFYYCALGEARTGLVLDHAAILKKAALDYENAALENDASNVLLTVARAYLQFGSVEEKVENRRLILALMERNLSPRLAKEARICLASLDQSDDRATTQEGRSEI